MPIVSLKVGSEGGNVSGLVISNSIADELPSAVRQALATLPAHQQETFEEDYRRRRKSQAIYFLIAVIFPIQHFLLGKTGLGIIFLLTFGGLWLWWVIEWFYTPFKRIPQANEELARSLVRDLKAFGST